MDKKDIGATYRLSREQKEALKEKIRSLETSIDNSSEAELDRIEKQLTKGTGEDTTESPKDNAEPSQENWQAIKAKIEAESAATAIKPALEFGKKQRPKYTTYAGLFLAAAAAMFILFRGQNPANTGQIIETDLTPKSGHSQNAAMECAITLRGKDGSAQIEGQTFFVEQGPIYVTGNCSQAARLHIVHKGQTEISEFRNLHVASSNKPKAIMTATGTDPINLRLRGAPRSLTFYVTHNPIQETSPLSPDWKSQSKIGSEPILWSTSHRVEEAK